MKLPPAITIAAAAAGVAGVAAVVYFLTVLWQGASALLEIIALSLEEL